MINRKWVLEKGADGLTFGERLADLMSKKGVKAIDVVKETTISQANFSNYQRDYYKENAPSPQSPKSEVILELARYFDVSADYLLGRVKEKSTDLDTSDICRKTGMEEEIVESMVSATTLSQKLTGADLARDFSTLSKAEQDEQLSCLAAAHKLEIMKFALRWANTFDAQQLEWHLGEACMIADKLKSAGITPLHLTKVDLTKLPKTSH